MNSRCGQTGEQEESCLPGSWRYNASLLTNGQSISSLPPSGCTEKEHMLLIKKNALPSIHPNKLQVFFGSLVPLLVGGALFLHNRFETWRVRGQRETERARWKGKGRTGRKKNHEIFFVFMLWTCGNARVKIPPTDINPSLGWKATNCINTAARTHLITSLWCISARRAPVSVAHSSKLWIIKC